MPLCNKKELIRQWPILRGKYSPIEFVKANFKRYTDPDPTNENEQQEKGKLNARVTRLFGTSFIDTIQNVLQDLEGYNKELRGLLTYMRSFQYMFSGEMAFTGNVLNAIELPNDYSLEIRILEQVRKILPTKLGDAPRIADVEVAERYDHHHQDIGGLQKMVTQIASATFGIVNKKFTLTPEIINTIKNDYSLRAKGYAKHFNMVAANSELKTDLETEINTVRQFADMIPKAFEELQDGQVEKPSHSWNTIMEQEPNAPAKLLSIVNGLGGQIMSSNQIKSVVQIPAAEQNDNSPLAAPPYLRERANG